MAVFFNDVQALQPSINLSLSRVGITGIKKVITLTDFTGNKNLFYTNVDLYVDLKPSQKGVHMSRFDESVTEVIDELISQNNFSIESLAKKIARQILFTQNARKAQVHLEIKYPYEKKTPISEKSTQQICKLKCIASSTIKKTKKIIGVEVPGFTVCPCAQDMVKNNAQFKLKKQGFNSEQIERILDTVSISSHNQRGLGTVLLGTSLDIRAQDLVDIVEQSMSCEVYGVLKRPDEHYVVEKSHNNPVFVEDVVRNMVKSTLTTFQGLEDEDFIWSQQRNFEGIHPYDVFAERYGLVKEIRNQLISEEYENSTSINYIQWLER